MKCFTKGHLRLWHSTISATGLCYCVPILHHVIRLLQDNEYQDHYKTIISKAFWLEESCRTVTATAAVAAVVGAVLAQLLLKHQMQANEECAFGKISTVSATNNDR